MIRAALALVILAAVSPAAVAAQDVPAPTRAFAIMTDGENGVRRNAQCSDYTHNADGSWTTARPMFFVIAEKPKHEANGEPYLRLDVRTYNILSPLTMQPGVQMNGIDVVDQLDHFCAR